MRAALYTRYGAPGDVLRIREVERPMPGASEVLIAVRAAAANPLDVHLMKGRPVVARLAFGLLRPKLNRPGVDVAGVVESVGPGVTRFKPGDAVFGSCRGAFADFTCAPEACLAGKPATVSFEHAASNPVAGYTALQGLRGRVRPGQRVLVNGASGGVGSFAVQIARAWGATVTGVCSTHNLDRVRGIGAERAIDYTATDFLRGSERYELIFDAVGTLSLPACKHILEPDGILIAAGGGVGPSPSLGRLAVRLLGGLLVSRFGSRKLVVCMAKRSGDDLATLAAMLERGEIVPLIDRVYPLDQAAEALAHVAQGHARGKVIVAWPR